MVRTGLKAEVIYRNDKLGTAVGQARIQVATRSDYYPSAVGIAAVLTARRPSPAGILGILLLSWVDPSCRTDWGTQRVEIKLRIVAARWLASHRSLCMATPRSGRQCRTLHVEGDQGASYWLHQCQGRQMDGTGGAPRTKIPKPSPVTPDPIYSGRCAGIPRRTPQFDSLLCLVLV